MHGNGPQVGLLACKVWNTKKVNPYPLDVLGSETGMIGYMPDARVQKLSAKPQHLHACWPKWRLIQMTLHLPVQPNPIGPIYEEAEARELAEKFHWIVKPGRPTLPSCSTKPAPNWHRWTWSNYRSGSPSDLYWRWRHSWKKSMANWLVSKRLSTKTCLPLSAKQFECRCATDSDRRRSGLPRQQADSTRTAQHYTRWTSVKFEFDAGSMGPKIEASCDHPTRRQSRQYRCARRWFANFLQGQAVPTSPKINPLASFSNLARKPNHRLNWN